ncbi:MULTISPECIES: MATE family efflux transporter [Rhodomicrobium]|uniref:MATE family efflux transporter n=1 Tax=Rhodomicrobium TaxID=1068 RepID=UPI000B4A77AD|nr:MULTISPECIES: MATE family efflux transporter [Rhodomicrobium]
MDAATERGGPAPLTYARVLAISLPIILSNITTPLLGLTNTAVIGQLGEAYLIGAVALGATIFTLLFWAFGFLRMGTTGLTAQADGAGDQAEVSVNLARALLLAGGAGTSLLLLQAPLDWLSFSLLDATQAVEAEAQTYFAIRIWSAPFALANYAFLGWFIGLGQTRTALVLQVVLNGANVALNIAFVSWLGWGVAGVAIGTVIAEAMAAVLGAVIAARELRRRAAPIDWRAALRTSGLMRVLAVNSDLMVRTLCLLFAFTFFTAQAAKAGEIILASNAILLNFLNVSSYLLDGFAFATEVLTGRAIGAGQRAAFLRAIRLSSVWAAGVSLVVSAGFLLGGGAIIDAMTTNAEVRETARLYLPWAVAAPVAGVACFQLDGIFIGATRTRDMRNMMLVSLALFLAAWALLTPAYGNHGLWASIIVFFIARALTLGAYYPALERASFGPRP